MISANLFFEMTINASTAGNASGLAEKSWKSMQLILLEEDRMSM
jgi:hypothetical protein